MYQIHFYNTDDCLIRVSLVVFSTASEAQFYASKCMSKQVNLPKSSRCFSYRIAKLIDYNSL